MVMHLLNIVLNFYIKKIPISLYITWSSKKVFSTWIKDFFLINNIEVVLLVINHIEILPLNNHLFNNRDIIKNFDIT